MLGVLSTRGHVMVSRELGLLSPTLLCQTLITGRFHLTNSTQFHGLKDEDAPGYLSRFARICDTFRITGVTEDAIYPRLFPFTLSSHSSTWLDTLPQDSITIWEDLQSKFLKKYYPPSKAARLRDQIHLFRMELDEPYHMVWERFNTLLSRCPQHGLSNWALVEKFYNRLTFEKQQMNFIPNTRTTPSTTRGVHEVTTETSVDAALAAMAKEIKELKLSAQKCGDNPSGKGGEGEHTPTYDVDEQVDEEIEMETPRGVQERRVPTSTAPNSVSPAEKEVEKKSEKKKKIPNIDLSRVPYPARLTQQKYAKDYGHFLELFKQLKINMPFVEALHHMPKYAKFLMDLLSNKKKLETLSTVTFNERCSAVVQNKLPEKLVDPGVFSIPCLFGSLTLHHALADLGASINLMPYSLFEKLGLGDPAPTRMSISLADRSVKYPCGIVENLLVKVDKFFFPADFIILDMEVDDRVPLILGRPFLRTAKALIDVFDGKITLHVGDENVTFDVMKSMKNSSGQYDSLFFIDTFISHMDRCLDYVCGADLLNTQHLGEENQEVETDVLPEHGPSHPASKHPEYPKVFEVSESTEEEKPSVEAPPSLTLSFGLCFLRCPVQVVPKKGGMTVVANEKNELIPTRTVTCWRVCINYRRLDDATRKDHFPLPFIDQMLERLSGQQFYCFLDGFSGYFQIPIAIEDQEKTTFTCPYGTFAYRRMPFWLCNAPATCQRCMVAIFQDMIETSMEVLMDDFSVLGSSFDQCLHNLEKMMRSCIKTKLMLNWEKCHFMVTEGIVLGHKVSRAGIEVDRAKIETIIGVVLGQRRDKHFHPIYYASKNLSDAQENYTTTEKELLAVIREEAIGDKFPHESLMMLSMGPDKEPVFYMSAEEQGLPWFSDIANYLADGLVDAPHLFRVGADRVLRRCVSKEEVLEILKHCHEGLTGGHNGPSYTAKKVSDSGFYWPSVFKDAHELVKRCDACQRTDNLSSRNEMPQNPIQRLFSRFGTPKALISDRGTHFCNAQMDKGVKRILEKTVGRNRKDWSDNLDDALWAFRTVFKTPIGTTPFRMVYGKASRNRYLQLDELEELRCDAYARYWSYKERTKVLHDRRLKGVKEFKYGERVLVYNSRLKLFPRKLKSWLTGPYIVKEAFPYGAVELQDETGSSWKVNGHRLKYYIEGPIKNVEGDEVLLDKPGKHN
ncbi:hypothetical protein L1987_08923 [Smallanthus sonchifolius]|uniref:Uncharacterized protein n=1 Tax=Smallanthus sonchifolius TaxID=185202 RepID=A0ACB9JMJ3_9ASTR|nr:hypothetical protein L1987_08923 [Smallanthus sonchifolius]